MMPFAMKSSITVPYLCEETSIVIQFWFQRLKLGALKGFKEVTCESGFARTQTAVQEQVSCTEEHFWKWQCSSCSIVALKPHMTLARAVLLAIL